jgi:predicted transglutaminase-like cysteine proteinase
MTQDHRPESAFPTYAAMPAPGDDDLWENCEDYAILKYALLRKAGLPETAMMIIVGEIASMPANIPHAWLLAWVGDAWRVLDNKFDQLIDPADYTNWIPRKGASRDRVLLFSRVFTLNEVADKSHGVSRHSTS